MIVKDPVQAMDKANEGATELLKIIEKKAKEYGPHEDPAEQIYFVCHLLGNLTARILIALEGYAKVYGIEKLTIDKLEPWIEEITKSHIKLNKMERKT